MRHCNNKDCRHIFSKPNIVLDKLSVAIRGPSPELELLPKDKLQFCSSRCLITELERAIC